MAATKTKGEVEEENEWCMIEITSEVENAAETVYIYEHERRLPLAGFSHMLFPGDPPAWADETGRRLKSTSKQTMPAGNGWKWCSDWNLKLDGDRRSTADVDGWSYADRFSSDLEAWTSERKNAHVRRRCWQRLRRRTSSAAEATRLLRAGRSEANLQREELHQKHMTGRRRPSRRSTKPKRKESHPPNNISLTSTKSVSGDSPTDDATASSAVPMREHDSTDHRQEDSLDASACSSVDLGASSVLGMSVVSPRMIVDDFADAVMQLRAEASKRASEGKWSESIEFLDRAIAAQGDRPDLYASRSRALCIVGQYARALTDANLCIATGSIDSKEGHKCKGEALLGMRQYDRAVKAFRYALQCDPADMALKRNLDRALEKFEGKSCGDD